MTAKLTPLPAEFTAKMRELAQIMRKASEAVSDMMNTACDELDKREAARREAEEKPVFVGVDEGSGDGSARVTARQNPDGTIDVLNVEREGQGSADADDFVGRASIAAMQAKPAAPDDLMHILRRAEYRLGRDALAVIDDCRCAADRIEALQASVARLEGAMQGAVAELGVGSASKAQKILCVALSETTDGE
jgi:hypothetical protein